MNGGLVLLDKPQAMSSRTAVDAVTRALGRKDVGHAGTLDPNATGLLVVAVGSATRWLPHLPGGKTYRATVRVGTATDTEDAWGRVVAQDGGEAPEPGAFRDALESLPGLTTQTVPMVSAVKVGGRRLYELAREGIEVPRAPRPVSVAAVRILALRGAEADFEVDCGPGTYVRTLCVEVGRRLGRPAHLAALRRLRSGAFDVASALPAERWERDALEAALLGPEAALGHLPERVLDPAEADGVAHGRPLPGRAAAGTWRLTAAGRLVALAEAGPDGTLRPKRVFA